MADVGAKQPSPNLTILFYQTENLNHVIFIKDGVVLMCNFVCTGRL